MKTGQSHEELDTAFEADEGEGSIDHGAETATGDEQDTTLSTHQVAPAGSEVVSQDIAAEVESEESGTDCSSDTIDDHDQDDVVPEDEESEEESHEQEKHFEFDRDFLRLARRVEFELCGQRRFVPLRRLAPILRRAVEEQKDQDADWLRENMREEVATYKAEALQYARQKADKLGYKPFTHMGKRVYDWIRRNCGDWVLELMSESLEDPEKIFPDWAVQFAATMRDMGRVECERYVEADVLFDAVTASPHWDINRQLRRPPKKLHGPQGNNHQRDRDKNRRRFKQSPHSSRRHKSSEESHESMVDSSAGPQEEEA